MTHEKVKAIADWPLPESPKEMRSFVGLSGVYRKFVSDFAKISAPHMELLTVGQKDFDACRADEGRWAEVRKAVELLRAAMIARPALALPQKDNYNCIVRADASDFAIDATLRQLQFTDHAAGKSGDAVERIIAYISRKLHDADSRYSTYDKELLGVRDAVEHWKYYLKSGHKFRVQNDHSALQHILDRPKLSGRQMRLLETLQEYDFDIECNPGARTYIQDALSRRSDYKKAPIPRMLIKQPSPPSVPLPSTTPVPAAAAELHPILAGATSADEWIDRLLHKYRACPYFADVLTALGGQHPPDNDKEVK